MFHYIKQNFMFMLTKYLLNLIIIALGFVVQAIFCCKLSAALEIKRGILKQLPGRFPDAKIFHLKCH